MKLSRSDLNSLRKTLLQSRIPLRYLDDSKYEYEHIKNNYPKFAEIIDSHFFKKTVPMDRNINIFYENDKQQIAAESCLYCLGKFLVLVSRRVVCLDLCELVAISDFDVSLDFELKSLKDSVRESDYVLVTNFQESDPVSFPFCEKRRFACSTFIKRGIEQGKGFIFCSESVTDELDCFSKWWPKSFVRFLRKNLRDFSAKELKLR